MPPGFNGALWDGEAHYYIDGTTELSGVMPVLRYDTETSRYESFLASAGGVEPDGGPLRVDHAGASRGHRRRVNPRSGPSVGAPPADSK